MFEPRQHLVQAHGQFAQLIAPPDRRPRRKVPHRHASDGVAQLLNRLVDQRPREQIDEHDQGHDREDRKPDHRAERALLQANDGAQISAHQHGRGRRPGKGHGRSHPYQIDRVRRHQAPLADCLNRESKAEVALHHACCADDLGAIWRLLDVRKLVDLGSLGLEGAQRLIDRFDRSRRRKPPQLIRRPVRRPTRDPPDVVYERLPRKSKRQTAGANPGNPNRNGNRERKSQPKRRHQPRAHTRTLA